jgi:hypothetical protein
MNKTTENNNEEDARKFQEWAKNLGLSYPTKETLKYTEA